jgi:hypothetical protein
MFLWLITKNRFLKCGTKFEVQQEKLSFATERFSAGKELAHNIKILTQVLLSVKSVLAHYV